MATPTTGPLKFSDLRTEFNATGPVKLSQFYRGRFNNQATPYIRDNKAVQQNSILNGVPVGGTPTNTPSIKMSQLRGVFRHYGYTFTYNAGIFTGKGVGQTILDGLNADFTISYDKPGSVPTDAPVFAEVTIPASTTMRGIVVTSKQGSGETDRQTYPAFKVFSGGGGVSTDSVAYIINYGNILGFGGAGGNGANLDGVGQSGFDGGHAIVYGRTMFLENYGAVYAGGGGGGGGGFLYGAGFADDRHTGSGGGGGQGWNVSAGGNRGIFTNSDGTRISGIDGSDGGPSGAGQGGGPTVAYGHINGVGGNGGTWGNPGGRGLYGKIDGSITCNSWNTGGAGCGSVRSGDRSANTGGESGFAGRAIRKQTVFSPSVGTFTAVGSGGTSNVLGGINYS